MANTGNWQWSLTGDPTRKDHVQHEKAWLRANKKAVRPACHLSFPDVTPFFRSARLSPPFRGSESKLLK